ncbi:MAG: DUF86 domain-containing protein [Flavobacteriaceae bacterium]|nr:DUF86 domain-containing protein [Flavobacteriaceae bacterium]
MNEILQENLQERLDNIQSLYNEWHWVIRPIQNKDHFLSDLKNQKLIYFQSFLIIEETRMMANEIYPPIKEKCPNIEWRAFTRIRNRIAYHYPTLRDVWLCEKPYPSSRKRELPYLRKYIQSQQRENKVDTQTTR